MQEMDNGGRGRDKYNEQTRMLGRDTRPQTRAKGVVPGMPVILGLLQRTSLRTDWPIHRPLTE